MKKFLMIGVALVSLSACTTTEQGATVGAVTGGVLGAAVTGNAVGTVVGAGVGAVAGAALGQVAGQPGRCYYRNSRGRTFVDRCPRG
ncbi:MAG: rane protein [Hyphomicrobiales bacterium]|nr:rane protein [Hyphomicrobiales bacterium]